MEPLEIVVPGESAVFSIDIIGAGHAKELVEAANGFEIKNDEDLGRAADLTNKCDAVFKDIDKQRDSYVRPMFECERHFNAHFKAITEPLKATETRLRAMMRDFRQFQKRETDKEAAEQRRVQREMEAAAKESGEAPPPPPPPAQLKPVSGQMGGKATLKQKWVHELVDITEVPLRFLMVNDAMVKQSISGGARGREIPGIRIFDEGTVATR